MNRSEKIHHDTQDPVFTEPWQAQAFAMAVALQERGVISRKLWAQTLGAQLAATPKSAEMSHNDHYYHCWLSALEKLVEQLGLIDPVERSGRQQAWDKAARATPHGEPIMLGREKTGFIRK